MLQSEAMKLFSKFILVSLSIGLLSAGCGESGGDLPDVDCGSVTVVPFTQVTLLSETCTGCHSSTLAGEARGGAPASINFDTYDSAKASAESAVAAVYNGSMPPGGSDLPTDQKDQLYAWGLCGTPQ